MAWLTLGSLAFTCIITLTGCKPPGPDTPPDAVLATAYGASFTATDLMAVLPSGLAPEDSTARAHQQELLKNLVLANP